MAKNNTVGMLWIDVEGTEYWSSSTSSNVNFIQQMVDEGNRQGVTLGKDFYIQECLGCLLMLGIYSSKSPFAVDLLN